MSTPTNIPQDGSQTQDWFSDVEDVDLDKLFGEEAEPASPAASPAPAVQPPAQTTVEEPFLQASTGTVYKTRDDAVKGTEHKDKLIAQLRDELGKATGVDPISRQPVTRTETQPGRTKPYLEDPLRYYNDFGEAVSKKDFGKSLQVQAQLVREIMQQELGPVVPVITNVGKQQAVAQLVTEIPDIATFVTGDDYKGALDKNPILKEAIQLAETNFQLQHQLPQLYRLAYAAHQASRVPELVKAASQQATQNAAPRVTMQPATMTPNSASTSAEPNIATSEGRKEIIRRLEDKGVLDRQL